MTPVGGVIKKYTKKKKVMKKFWSIYILIMKWKKNILWDGKCTIEKRCGLSPRWINGSWSGEVEEEVIELERKKKKEVGGHSGGQNDS